MTDYVKTYTYKDEVGLMLDAGHPAVFALGQRLEALCPEAYMNGYNWEALLRYYLKERDPDILEDLDPDPEGDMYAAHWPLSPEHQARAERFAGVIRSLIEDGEVLCRLVEEHGGEIEWD